MESRGSIDTGTKDTLKKNSASIIVIPDGSSSDDVARCITGRQGKYDADGSIYIQNLDKVFKNYERWERCLPRIDLHYALKCENDEKVLRILKHLGAGFECATQREVQKLLEISVLPSRIIINNPVRTGPCLRYLAKHGIDTLSVDSVEELVKVKQLHPDARLLLRVHLPPDCNEKNTVSFGLKFGCHVKDATVLLKKAKEFGLKVIGAAYHQGSGQRNPESYARAIKQLAELFAHAHHLGFKLDLLDIGGGIRGEYDDIEIISVEINKALDKYFPAEAGVKVIAEPGRYMASSTGNVYMNIIGKRRRDVLLPLYNDLERSLPMDEAMTTSSYVGQLRKFGAPEMMYICNESIYSLFGFNFISDDVRQIEPLNPKDSTTPVSSIIYGMSCYGGDILHNYAFLPEMNIGDWLVVRNIGHYAKTMGTNFNSLPKYTVYSIVSEKYRDKLQVANPKTTTEMNVLLGGI